MYEAVARIKLNYAFTEVNYAENLYLWKIQPYWPTLPSGLNIVKLKQTNKQNKKWLICYLPRRQWCSSLLPSKSFRIVLNNKGYLKIRCKINTNRYINKIVYWLLYYALNYFQNYIFYFVFVWMLYGCCDVAVANIISVKILERPLNALNVSVSYDKCYVIFL